MPKRAFLGTFWKVWPKNCGFLARAPSKLVCSGAQSAFRKFLGYINKNWYLKIVQRGDPLSRQGVESLRGADAPPPPPLNPLLTRAKLFFKNETESCRRGVKNSHIASCFFRFDRKYATLSFQPKEVFSYDRIFHQPKGYNQKLHRDDREHAKHEGLDIHKEVSLIRNFQTTKRKGNCGKGKMWQWKGFGSFLVPLS